MDALDHMLTDPLDSGEGSDGRITEECMLGNCQVSLPEDLLEDPEIFFSVLSESTWSEVLTDDQRQHLRQLLPHFQEDNTCEQDSTISKLFNKQNFCFGNPLHLAQKLFQDGHFNPEVVKYRQLCAKSQKKRQLNSLQQYYHKLLKQILVSRKELLELAVRSGPDIAVNRKYPTQTHGEVQEQRVRGRVCRILREVKTECGDSNASSDDDDTASWLPTPQSPSSPTPTVSVRVLPSLSTQDMKTTDKQELGEKDMRAMLRRHREKRRRQPDHPDLMTSDIRLGDMMSRVNIGRKGSMMSEYNVWTIARQTSHSKIMGINGVGPPFCCKTASTLLGRLSLEEKVQQWQTSPASSLNPWFSSASCWSEMVLPALHFLAGETKVGMLVLPSGFTPYVAFRENSQRWKWIGPSQDGEKDLSALCQLWVDSKDLVVVKVFSWTDFVVRPSTGDERHVFQVQEQQRYDQPHKAFTFRMHGFESVVGPVKGVFDKEMSLNKAREHTLLRSDRPAYVTILSLVRDAAARLPNGEGTRAEICELLKDSQFLAPDVTSAQVNTVVSGALDRLHYEKDPCVKYDIGRKLWIYLHRDRGQEEFERIHQAQAAAAKARKALQQKPKPASKPVSPTNLFIVLLVSPPPMPQLGTLLSSSQSGPQVSQPATSQHTARIVGHQSGTLPQVRVVSSQTAGGQHATLVHQTPHQIRVPVTMGTKGITQVAITGQLGIKSQGRPGLPITTTNLRIQGKDVLRLPPSSITTDSKGQTVLRITPDMMATLTKSPLTTVKLTPDILGTATTKSISATLHVAPPHSTSSPASSSGEVRTSKASAGTTTLLKAAGDTIRLMPTLAVTMAEQKTRTFSTVSSSDSKSGTTIRIMPGLGVIPQKQGQTITMTTTTGSKPVSTGAATVTIATSGLAGAKGVTVGSSASGSLTLGTATATVRQVPVTATGKLPARFTVPLSVLSQPLKSKSVMTTPILKGNLSTNISSLGRNIILTTMPAGTKLIAGNKPVSFVTAQQLQQLQQQGQATQVRIQTVPAQQLQQRSAAGSPKSMSTVVVTTAPSPKRAPDPPPPAQ
uniref:Nuclear factor related to kappaB binding protein n=1 Tax=Oncorhynchus mykiss TaxID=8022 RepID=A0A8K9WVP2_ONCMY